MKQNHSGIVLGLFAMLFLLRVWGNGSLKALLDATTTGSTGGKVPQRNAEEVLIRFAAIALTLGILLAMADTDAWKIAVTLEVIALIYLLLHTANGPASIANAVSTFIAPKTRGENA